MGPNVFLEPLVPSFQDLYVNGVTITIPAIQAKIAVKGMILNGTAGLLARGLYLNINIHSGRFGCHKCPIEGEKYDDGSGRRKRGNHRIFRFQEQINLRTEE